MYLINYSGAHDSNEHVDVDSFSILSISISSIKLVIIHVLFTANQSTRLILLVNYPPTIMVRHCLTQFPWCKLFFKSSSIFSFFNCESYYFCRGVSVCNCYRACGELKKKFLSDRYSNAMSSKMNSRLYLYHPTTARWHL